MNSIKHNKIYIGFTSNLKKRFIDHNEGESGWTKRYRPWELVYYEAFRSEEDARKREASLKGYGNALRELKKRLKLSLGGTGLGGGAGFTLIETLMVVFLMGIVLVAGGGMFFGIMKSSSKAEVEKEVKQNGEYALAIMGRMIRNSRRVEACDPDNFLIIENLDRNTTKFHVDNGRIASSSGAPTYSNHLYLVSENIEVSSSPSLSFTCYPEDYTLPSEIRRVEINFSLSPKGGSPEAPESFAEIQFQTSISLRNF